MRGKCSRFSSLGLFGFMICFGVSASGVDAEPLITISEGLSHYGPQMCASFPHVHGTTVLSSKLPDAGIPRG